MSLMKLAPETVRLRRVAKAHAVGEFSLSEYRRARREVIANFDAARMPDDDDTRPRGSKLQASAEAPIEQQTEPRGRRSWRRWLLLGCVVLVAGPLLADTRDQAARLAEPGVGNRAEQWIAPVAERDPNPATSRRLPVSAVRLRPFASQLDVSAEALQALVDDKLAEIRQRNRPGEHGFTRAELDELGRMLNALGAHDADVALSLTDAQDLTALLKDQKYRRGVSVVELEEIAAAVQARLRDAGYFLAVAYLPSQSVTGGLVEIAVLPGVIGEVRIAGADQRLETRFHDLLGEPVTLDRLNTRLYALNQSPGVVARAGFEPGSEIGEARLNLEVLEQRRWAMDVTLDNHGDAHTGKQRLNLSGALLSPRGRGDSLHAGLVAALDPSNQLLGQVEYRTPIGARRQLRGRLARNTFNTGNITDPGNGSVADIDAEGWVLDAMLETYLHRDREAGVSYELGIGHHALDWSHEAGKVEQDVYLLSGALNLQRVWDELRVAADLRLYADVGAIGGETFAGQDDGFWDLGFRLFGWHPLDLPVLPGRQKLALEMQGQFADGQLPSTRRLALGGALGARGFERDAYLADGGVLLRVDLRTPLSLGELAVFADAAYGKVENSLLPGWAHVSNLGLSWDVMVGGRLQSRLSWALPITAKGSEGLDDDGSKLFWSLHYAY